MPSIFVSSQLTLVGELKEITESFEKLDSGVSRHDHLKQIHFLYLKIGQHFNMIEQQTSVSPPIK
jgi:hypothetical protein